MSAAIADGRRRLPPHCSLRTRECVCAATVTVRVRRLLMSARVVKAHGSDSTRALCHFHGSA